MTHEERAEANKLAFERRMPKKKFIEEWSRVYGKTEYYWEYISIGREPLARLSSIFGTSEADCYFRALALGLIGCREVRYGKSALNLHFIRKI